MLRLLFPVKCPYCGEILAKGYVCPECEAALSRPSGEMLKAYARIVGCRWMAAPCLYEGVLRESFLRFKFRGAPSYAKAYARQIAPLLREDVDAITYAPMRYARANRRGYNQAKLLAQEIARLLGKPCLPLLRKTRRNRQQHTLSGDARLANVADLYAVTRDVTGYRILLIDDIVTTGSTMAAMCRCLRDADAEWVACAALAVRGGQLPGAQKASHASDFS